MNNKDDIDNIKYMLFYLSNKLQKIEDKDPDYVQNKNYQILRAKQDEYYLKLAKKELELYELDNKRFPNEYKQQKIDFYKDYIKRNERNEEKEN